MATTPVTAISRGHSMGYPPAHENAVWETTHPNCSSRTGRRGGGGQQFPGFAGAANRPGAYPCGAAGPCRLASVPGLGHNRRTKVRGQPCTGGAVMTAGRWLVVPAGLLLATAAAAAPPERLAPFFRPSAEFADDFGAYRSPLKFDDGSPVKTADDWKRRRQEILKAWHDALGSWPALIDQPRLEYLEKERGDGATRHHVRLEVAPKRTTEDAYLLVPDGRGPFPAVLVVFYDAKTGVGLGKAERLDFAAQLAKRGFVALSLGSPPATY